MPAPTPPAVRDRALALLEGGMSTRAVEERMRAEGTPIGKTTVAALDKARKAGTAKGRPSKSAASKASASPPVEPPPDEEGVSLEQLVDGASSRDVRRLERTSALVSERVEVALNEKDTRTIATLVPLSLQISKALAGLRPPPKVDPEADPANIAARDELRARIERLASEAELDDAKGEMTRATMRAHLDRLDASAARSRVAEAAT